MKVKAKPVIIGLLTGIIITSILALSLHQANPIIKEITVIEEIIVFTPRDSSLTNFDIRNVDLFYADFMDDDFQFIRGDFSFCDMEWCGYWDCMVTISETKITNCTFDLTNFDILLENCIVKNCYFKGASQVGVHLNKTTFLGENIFDVNVVDRGGNTGFENVQFNEGIFDWD